MTAKEAPTTPVAIAMLYFVGVVLLGSAFAYEELPKFEQLLLLYPGWPGYGGEYHDRDIYRLIGITDLLPQLDTGNPDGPNGESNNGINVELPEEETILMGNGNTQLLAQGVGSSDRQPALLRNGDYPVLPQQSLLGQEPINGEMLKPHQTMDSNPTLLQQPLITHAHNTAALRMSYTLNRYGGRHSIGSQPVYLSRVARDSITGNEEVEFIFRNTAFGPYLALKYGDPTLVNATNSHHIQQTMRAVMGKQGIIRFVSYHKDHAGGHIALWDCDHFHQSRDWTREHHLISVEFWESPDSMCPEKPTTNFDGRLQPIKDLPLESRDAKVNAKTLTEPFTQQIHNPLDIPGQKVNTEMTFSDPYIKEGMPLQDSEEQIHFPREPIVEEEKEVMTPPDPLSRIRHRRIRFIHHSTGNTWQRTNDEMPDSIDR